MQSDCEPSGKASAHALEGKRSSSLRPLSDLACPACPAVPPELQGLPQPKLNLESHDVAMITAEVGGSSRQLGR